MSNPAYLSRIAAARSSRPATTSQEAYAQVDRMAKSTNDISASADQMSQTGQMITESFQTFGRKLEEKDGKILGAVESLTRIAESPLNKITSMEREIELLHSRAEQVNGG